MRVDDEESSAATWTPRYIGLQTALEIEKMSAVRQKLRPGELQNDRLGMRVERRCRRRDTARSRDSGHRGVSLTGEHDDAVRVPGTAAAGSCCTEHLRHPAGRINLLEFATREKRNEPAVGRPERIRRALGAGERLCLYAIKRANPELRRGTLRCGDEREMTPVWRERQLRGGRDRCRRQRHVCRRLHFEPDEGGGRGDGRRYRPPTARPIATEPRIPAAATTAFATRRAPVRGVPATAVAPDVVAFAPSAAQRRADPKSDAVCHRSSGFFARHLRTMESTSGGARLCTVVSGGGSRSRMAATRFVCVFPSNAFFPGDHLVEHAAEREDVGARVCLAALHLLGRHVLERAEDCALRRDCLRRRRGHVGGARDRQGRRASGKAEIKQLGDRRGGGPAAPDEEDIARFQVAMDDPLPVGRGERVGHLHRDPQRFVQRQAGSPGRGAGASVLERFPVQQLHDEKRGAGMLADVVQGTDVRMGEL